MPLQKELALFSEVFSCPKVLLRARAVPQTRPPPECLQERETKGPWPLPQSGAGLFSFSCPGCAESCYFPERNLLARGAWALYWKVKDENSWWQGWWLMFNQESSILLKTSDWRGLLPVIETLLINYITRPTENMKSRDLLWELVYKTHQDEEGEYLDSTCLSGKLMLLQLEKLRQAPCRSPSKSPHCHLTPSQRSTVQSLQVALNRQVP